MTTLYVINLLSNAKGYHLVHRYGCPDFPDNFYELGLFETCTKAAKSAKNLLPKIICCPNCIKGCKDPEHKDTITHPHDKILNSETE